MKKDFREFTDKKKFYQKIWFKIFLALLLMILLGGGIFVYKTGNILSKISSSDDSGIRSLFNLVGGDGVETDEDGRINLALFGMRGENIPGGGLLADTIMIVSLKPEENKVAIISIPRDLYVKMPGTEQRMKINAVHHTGEQKEKGAGLKAMEQVLSEITGLNIKYSASLNFVGFKQLIDAVGGIDIFLETPFYETSQFVLGKECGIEFTLPAGNNHLDGETALCYARARENTSDFDRNKRQQLILIALKDKLISLGTISDFGKTNNILNAIGDNVRTDMDAGEMKNFFDKYSSMKDAELYRRVLENSTEGFLMVPQDAPKGAGYILIPRAGWDNYSEIHQMAENIFTLPPQSDIDPVKQYTKPQPKVIEDEDKKKKDKDKEDEKEDKDDNK